MVKVLGISSSPRKAGGTDTAVLEALKGAALVEGVETEFVSLHGKELRPCIHCDLCLRKANRCVHDGDDVADIIQKMFDADGIIVGSPVYDMTYNGQLACLFNRFRSRSHDLNLDPRPFASKVGGALAVGGSRNGGQEYTVGAILNFFMTQSMIVVGGEKWENTGSYIYSADQRHWKENHDPEGLETALHLGRRVAQVTRIVRANPTDIVLR